MSPVHLDGVLRKTLLHWLFSVVIARMPTCRLLLIDDHAMFRTGLAVLLRMSIAGLEVDEAGSVNDGLGVCATAPHAVLLDIMLKGQSGIEGIDQIKRQWPDVPIIMVSSDANPQTVQRALARGACDFVSKEKSAQSILETVRKVLNLPEADTGVPSPLPPEVVEGSGLTPRQLEVLELLCQGLTNKAIGRKLELSENTVRWHVQGILSLLKVANRSEAAFAARQRGLIR
jgi:DNA-binding NarL/FixJ family response regulator